MGRWILWALTDTTRILLLMMCSVADHGGNSSVLRYLHLLGAGCLPQSERLGHVITRANFRKQLPEGYFGIWNRMILLPWETRNPEAMWTVHRQLVLSTERKGLGPTETSGCWRVQCLKHNRKVINMVCFFCFIPVEFPLGRYFRSFGNANSLCYLFSYIFPMVCWILPRRRKVAWWGKTLMSDYKSLCLIKKSNGVIIQSE